MFKLKLALCVLFLSGAVFGDIGPYTYTYTSSSIALGASAYDVTNIVSVECDSAGTSNCGVLRQNYLGPDSGKVLAGQTTRLDTPFWNTDLANPAQATMLLGVATDDGGQQHLVMFMDPAAASAIDGKLGWSDLFSSDTESDVINNLLLGTSGGYNWGNDWDTLSPGLWAIHQFAVPMRSAGFPEAPSLHPFFTIPAPGATATDFDAVMFSTGTIIGTGKASLLTGGTPLVPTPEPGTLEWMGSGLAVLIVCLVRHRHVSRSPAGNQ